MKKIPVIIVSLILMISILIPIVSSCRALNSSSTTSSEINQDEDILEITNPIIQDETSTADAKDKKEEKPTVKITKPEANYSYFFNIKLKQLENSTEITGPILVKANAESDNGIEKVEFYLDGKLKHVDTHEQYTWLWLLKPRSKENFTISVIAYDTEGNTNADSIYVIRSQFTPIRNHKFLAIALAAGLGAIILLRNRNKGVDEVVPVEPDDENRPFSDDSKDQSFLGAKSKEEGVIFWIVVIIIASIIATSLVLLFFKRKIFT